MEWFVWIVKESDALYVINFEATCFLNQEEPEDYEHWYLKESRWLPNGKGTKNALRGQFDALSRAADLWWEQRNWYNFVWIRSFPKVCSIEH